MPYPLLEEYIEKELLRCKRIEIRRVKETSKEKKL